MSVNNPLLFSPEVAGRLTNPNAAGTGAAPAQDNSAEMLRLLGGDLSGSLSSGDKLLALSGLLRSATRSGRRAGLTPQQVIGDLQKRKLAEVQGRMQVEQLRQKQLETAADQKYRTRLAELARGGTVSSDMLNRLGQEAISSGDVEQGLKFLDQAAKMVAPEAEPPPSRTRIEGGMEVFEEWNPATQTWTRISSGTRFNPRAGVTVNVGDGPGANVFRGVGPNGEPGYYVPE